MYIHSVGDDAWRANAAVVVSLVVRIPAQQPLQPRFGPFSRKVFLTHPFLSGQEGLEAVVIVIIFLHKSVWTSAGIRCAVGK